MPASSRPPTRGPLLVTALTARTVQMASIRLSCVVPIRKGVTVHMGIVADLLTENMSWCLWKWSLVRRESVMDSGLMVVALMVVDVNLGMMKLIGPIQLAC